MSNIVGRKVAVLATDGVEQIELTEPVKALQAERADVLVIAPHGGDIQEMQHHDKAQKLHVDRELSSVPPNNLMPSSFQAAWRIPTHCGRIRMPSHSSGTLFRPTSRSRQSAMAHGR